MEIISSLFSLLSQFKNIPVAASAFLSLLVLFVAYVLQNRKINIEEKTSISSTQQKQLETLMHQITLLSDELDKTRDQLSELHNQNIELMTQLREANRRIGELEALLEKHKVKS